MSVECINPHRPRRGVEWRCGRCLPCLRKRQSELVARVDLDMCRASFGVFLTCTYSDEHLPPGGEVSPERFRAMTHWLGRARPAGLGLRFLSVEHYGSRTRRPHQHHLAWGDYEGDLAMFEWEVTRRWVYGHVQVSPLESGAVEYVARHQVECRWAPLVDPMVADLHPALSARSRRPALGWSSLRDGFGGWFASGEGQAFLERARDVPGTMHTRGVRRSFGRLLKCKLRDYVSAPGSVEERLELEKARVLAKNEGPDAVERRWRNLQSYDVLKERVLAAHRRKRF